MPPKVQVDIKLTERVNYRTKVFQRTLSDVRTRFCAQVSLAEELLPLNVVRDFYLRHDAYARLALEFPDATVHRDALPWATVRAYRETFAGEPMPSTVAVCMKSALSRARQVAAHGFVSVPRACASATLVCAYASLQCENLFRQQCWFRSSVPAASRSFRDVYPTVDFQFWVKYGSWSRCPHCGVMHYNDKYFSHQVYDDKATSSTPAESVGMRQHIPDDPVEHSDGNVGVTSRWWYLSGMYHPEAHCGACTKPEAIAEARAGETFLDRIQRIRKRKYAAAGSLSARGVAGQSVVSSQELYRVPCVDLSSRDVLSSNCIFWPRYCQREFVLMDKPGDCMLELTEEESRALTVVVLVTKTQSQTYGAAHHANLKKVCVA